MTKEELLQRAEQLREENRQVIVNALHAIEESVKVQIPAENQPKFLDNPMLTTAALLRAFGFPADFFSVADSPEEQNEQAIPNGAHVSAKDLPFSESVKVFRLMKEFYENRHSRYDAQISLAYFGNNAVVQNLGHDYLTKLRGEEAAQALRDYSKEFEDFTDFLLLTMFDEKGI